MKRFLVIIGLITPLEKVLYLAGLAFFKPKSGLLTVVYKEAKFLKNEKKQLTVKANQFLYK